LTASTTRPKTGVFPTCPIETIFGGFYFEWQQGKWSTSEDTICGSDVAVTYGSILWTTLVTMKKSLKPSATNRPRMVLMMQESVEQLFSHLGVGQLRDLAGAKLEGYSNTELAQRFGCSERTIERRLHLIREKMSAGIGRTQ
jgi:hypothetical protein